ncbi:hypothetical protein PM082_006982 [Marasmius tenuissimus]|nr:hypothetical protein PM082_006982 [Marasmius tenuissimus]
MGFLYAPAILLPTTTSLSVSVPSTVFRQQSHLKSCNTGVTVLSGLNKMYENSRKMTGTGGRVIIDHIPVKISIVGYPGTGEVPVKSFQEDKEDHILSSTASRELNRDAH